MELGKKQLTTIFTLAAGLGFGAVTGIVHLLQSDGQNDTAPKTTPAQSRQKAAATESSLATGLPAHATDAVITQTSGENVFHARLHTWVGQFAMVSVCVRDKVTAPKPCDFEAVVSDGKIQAGQTVHLKDMTPVTAGIAPHAIKTDLPNIRPRQDVLPGPLPAQVVKLVDGDTVQVIAETFKNHYVLTDIRVGEIDTPEKKGRAKCAAEAALAEKASAATSHLVLGKTVYLYNVQFEKYGGRVLGDIRTPEGVSVAQNLIEKNLARPYDGGKKQSWCM